MVDVNLWRDLMDVLREFDNACDIKVGEGLELRRTGAGTSISSNTQQPAVTRINSEKEGTLVELAHVQSARDVDTWEITDKHNVKIDVITDHWYDPTTFKEQYRTRTLEFTARGRLKSISAESDPATVVFEAAECQAQPD